MSDGDNGQLDTVLDYLAFVAQSPPLSLLLDEAPKKIAASISADIVSVYLLEGDGRTLVMRGNLGFPQTARGTVRLRVGEGITGLAVETMYPVSSAAAPTHASYRAFPELDEERFPAFVAVPIMGAREPLGAVVVQRAGLASFSEPEICLLCALTAPISSAVRLANLLDDLHDKDPPRSDGGTARATVPGIPIVAGKALGAVAALRRPASSSSPHADGQSPTANSARDQLDTAIELAHRGIAYLLDLAARQAEQNATAFLRSYLLMLEDQRLRTRVAQLLDGGQSLAVAIGEVAREATRTAAKGGDPFLLRRASDIEQLCDALLMLASPDTRASLPSRAVLLGDALTVYDLLISARAHPAGVVLTRPLSRDDPEDDRTRVLIELLGVPAIVDARGAFRWAAPGDIALLDADHGFLIVNPSRSEIAALRAERREQRTSSPGTI